MQLRNLIHAFGRLRALDNVNFMKLLYFLLLTFAIYYLLKALYRLARLFVSGQHNSTASNASEGDVRIEGKPKRFFSRSRDKGEYVDYEEIK